MRNKSGTNKILFVLITFLMSLATAYAVTANIPQTYKAQLYFQIGVGKGKPRPDMDVERGLLLSDTLINQTMRDTNFLPVEATLGFRGFSLGPDYKKGEIVKTDTPFIDSFRDHLTVKAFKDSSTILIEYESADAQEARSIVETLFKKFRAWRRPDETSYFDKNLIEADKLLTEKREIFLQSQKEFLDYVGSLDQEASSALKEQKAALNAKISSLRLRYGPKHPVLLEALQEQAALDQTASAVQPAITGQEKLLQLKQKMEMSFKDLDQAIRQSVYLDKQNQEVSGFVIVPLGDTTVTLEKPELAFNLIFAGLSALFLSLLYLNLRSLIRPTFKSAIKNKKPFGIPIYAQIPLSSSLQNADIKMPGGDEAEALKTLRQEIKLYAGAAPAKMITVTSTHRWENRSAIVTGLGRLAARGGEKVLLLDADLRMPSFQTSLPLKPARNLVDYLSGQARLEDIIVRTDASGAHIIYATAVPNTALDLLSSEKMKTLLLSLREAYDLVLILAPDTAAGPDARVLAKVSDRTLYIVDRDKTLTRDIKNGISLFLESHIDTMAFVSIYST